jgi:protein-disulfide isomerase
VLEQYPKDVKVVYKGFPLQNHKFSRQALIAALAAGEQGKFWEFHDALFREYSQLSDQKIQEIAASLGLDLAKFEAAKKSPQIPKLIARDLQEAQRIGIRGTPTIYVDGRLLRNRSLQGFRELIDADLAKRGSAPR